MIRKIILPFFLLITTAIHAQRYIPADAGSKVHFNIRNFGIKTGGELKGLKGEILFFTSDMPACNFNVTVDATTIDTDNEGRDKHLKEEDYFNVEKFPTITIASTRIEKTNKTDAGDIYLFTGTVTIKGVAKAISFPFHVEKTNDTYLFTGDFEINRLDFGIGSSSAVLSNTVGVSLSVSAKKS